MPTKDATPAWPCAARGPMAIAMAKVAEKTPSRAAHGILSLAARRDRFVVAEVDRWLPLNRWHVTLIPDR